MGPDTRSGGPQRGGVLGTLASWAPSLVTLLLLGGMTVEVSARQVREDTSGYHARLKELAAVAIPYSIGDWLGRKLESPPAAVEMLHSNVLINRMYTNSRTGEMAGFLFVQCADARDLIGHFPPVCYPAHGQVKMFGAARDWKVGDEQIHGMRYGFRGKTDAVNSDMVVDNFMVLPNGVYGRDMDAVNKVAQSADLRHFGAAQIQILTNAAMSDARRDEVLRSLIEPIVPLLRSVVTGVANEHD